MCNTWRRGRGVQKKWRGECEMNNGKGGNLIKVVEEGLKYRELEGKDVRGGKGGGDGL